MKYIHILFGSLFLMTACSADLDQSPPNFASADSLTDFEGVLNAAYFPLIQRRGRPSSLKIFIYI